MADRGVSFVGNGSDDIFKEVGTSIDGAMSVGKSSEFESPVEDGFGVRGGGSGNFIGESGCSLGKSGPLVSPTDN
jgi:hypothetical protein